MGVLFEKWRYGLYVLVQKPGYSVLAIEKNCNGLEKQCRNVHKRLSLLEK